MSLQVEKENSQAEFNSNSKNMQWEEDVELLIVGLISILLFLLGVWVGLATSWPAYQHSLTPGSRFFSRTVAVMLGILAGASVHWRLHISRINIMARSGVILQGIVFDTKKRLDQLIAGADERSLRIASQKALLLNLEITEKLEGCQQTLLEELTKLEQENRELRISLVATSRNLSDNTKRLESISKDSAYDPLTHLANRKGFDQHLYRACEALKTGHSFSLVLVDIDHFKDINESYGQMMGDTALKGIAALLRDSVRPHDLVSRCGGEEFAIILAGSKEDASRYIAERLRSKLGEAILNIGGVPLRVTASFGVAEAQLAEDPGELLARADQALFFAKNAGRNRVASYSDLPQPQTQPPKAE